MGSLNTFSLTSLCFFPVLFKPAHPERPGRRRGRAPGRGRGPRHAALQAQAPRGAEGARGRARGARQQRHSHHLRPQQPAGGRPAGPGSLPGGAERGRGAVRRAQRPHRVGQVHADAPPQGRGRPARESAGDHGVMTSRGLAGLTTATTPVYVRVCVCVCSMCVCVCQRPGASTPPPGQGWEDWSEVPVGLCPMAGEPVGIYASKASCQVRKKNKSQSK